ncbi:LETM1 domain-containing protein 1 [Microcaecilia unicolor]|uniref:LETM1 domain-containing protein 1 n=1 Tax=Microcaecilia unicolor TaxID=1415580 RepID=A0A6P7XF24_9AMPH|nr:LETM1 domain-containing protein 1 [Microcaecilia unicolor]
MALSRLSCCRWLLLYEKEGAYRLAGGRHPSYQLSTNTKPKKLLSAISSRVKYMSEKYNRFLERKFPRFYILYSTFIKGCQLLFLDGKEVIRIKKKMAHQGLKFYQLPYREMEKLRQFRRDIIKGAPVLLIAIPPFANYLVLVLMYFFPRQFLIQHFWTDQQQVEFFNVYHSNRAEAYPAVLSGLQQAVPRLQDQLLKEKMLQLCTEVQHGSHPAVAELESVSRAFSGPPLDLKHLKMHHMKALSRVLFLTPHLPTFLLRWRLWNHTFELHHLDKALLKLGVHELSDKELKNACYVRGLNSTQLSSAECKIWLTQWLQLSSRLKDSEASLLLFSLVLLSTNYIRSFRH